MLKTKYHHYQSMRTTLKPYPMQYLQKKQPNKLLQILNPQDANSIIQSPATVVAFNIAFIVRPSDATKA